MGWYSGLGWGKAGHPGWPHSLPLHLLLLLEDLVGFHRQPLLHQKLLSLQLALPDLCQPLPVCHEQLPALMGRKWAACSVPWEPRSPLPEFEGQDLGCLLISVAPPCQALCLLLCLTQASGWAEILPSCYQSFREGEPLAFPRSVWQRSGV